MAGSPSLLPWIGGSPVDVDHFDDLIEPYRGELVARVGTSDEGVVARAVEAAHAAGPLMAAMPVHERARLLRAAAELLEARQEGLARAITAATGKVISHTRRETARSPWTSRAAASAAETLTTTTPPPDLIPGGERVHSIALRCPVGVVAAITPFNAPLNLVLHKVAPALAGGNTVVVKPAPQAPGPAIELAELLTEVGFPPGAVNVVPGGAATGQALLAQDRVVLVSFTGGAPAGRAIRAAAGLRPVLLELGGNSANIVHHDADVQLALDQIVRGGFSNNGQSCNSVQRVLVADSLYEEFSERLAERASELVLGDPMDPKTDIGPLISSSAAERVHEHIREAASRGATIRTGGGRHDAVIEPTVMSAVDPTLRLYCDELFAPVVLTEPYRTLDQAITQANRTRYGLQVAIFTRSIDVATEAYTALRAGSVVVNRSSNFRLDQLPYGGVDESGSGREGPLYAAEAMTYLKTMVIAPPPGR
ncbi:MAG: aldehyde dehydrogenase family protein [Nocardioidaceae bacterium]